MSWTLVDLLTHSRGTAALDVSPCTYIFGVALPVKTSSNTKQFLGLHSKMQSSSVPLLYLHLLILSFLLLQQAYADASTVPHGGISLRSQQMALLRWKSTLDSFPVQMSSWQHQTSPCNWKARPCTMAAAGLGWCPTSPCQVLASMASLVSSTSQLSHSSHSLTSPTTLSMA